MAKLAVCNLMPSSVTNRLSIGKVFHRRTIFCAVIFFPVFHEKPFQPDNLVEVKRAAETDESTPPDIPTMTRCCIGLGIQI